MDRNREKCLESLMGKLSQIMKSMQAVSDFPFGDFYLSRSQFMILFFIAPRKNGATVKDLAKFIGVTPGAVTQLIDILVDKNLVVREGDRQDRRIISIRLTSGAKKQFQRFKKEYFKNISCAFDGLSTAELGQFIEFVEKIKFPLHQAN